MTTDNFQIYQLALAVRVITAGICGVIIGLERLTRSKSAGVRTHCIVAVGAALMMAGVLVASASPEKKAAQTAQN